MLQFPSETDQQKSQDKGGHKANRTPKKPADYLSYKTHETTEDHITKGQHEARKKSTNMRPDTTKRLLFSRPAPGDSNESNNATKSGNIAELEPNMERQLSKTQSGKNGGAGRKQNNRKPAHSRSQSHTKINTRLSTSVGTNKPYLSRLKSTDGIIPKRPAVKRNNRSQTKLSTLHPLTKTILNGSLNRALGALQPLTKTMLRESLKLYGLRKTVLNGSGKSTQMALTKTDLNQSIKSNKSSNSLKSMNFSGRSSNKSTTSLKGLSGLTGLPQGTGLKTSAKREKAILRLNEEDTYHEYEDMSEDSGHEADDKIHVTEDMVHFPAQNIEKEQLEEPEEVEEMVESEKNGETRESEQSEEPKEPKEPKEHDSEEFEQSVKPEALKTLELSSLPLAKEKEQEQGALGKDEDEENEEVEEEEEMALTTPPRQPKSPPFVSEDSRANSAQSFSNDEEQPINTNLYGGSFLLSQSTGMTRKLEPSNEMLHFVPAENNGNGKGNINKVHGHTENGDIVNSLTRTGGEKTTGILFKPRGEDELRTESEPAVTKATATPGSYQPNQTIFSNLQRNDSRYLSNIKHQKQQDGAPHTCNVTPVSSQAAVAAAAAEIGDQKKDFSSYLTSQQGSNSNNNIETRTQQRLWLQRENSLLDVSANMDLSRVGNFSNLSLNKLMFAHNYNSSGSNPRETPGAMANWMQNADGGPVSGEITGPSTPTDASINAANMMYIIQSGQQNSIQSRTEFERLNREYVNVRRHLNPVAESLNRVQKHGHGKTELEVQKKQEKKGTYAATNNNANSFREFAPSWEKEDGESILLLNKIWQDALILSSSMARSTRLLQLEQQQQQQILRQQQLPQQQQQRLGEYANQSVSQDFLGTNQMKQQRRNLGGSSVSRSVGPTTRALKMAASQSTPGIDSRQ